MFNSGVFSGTVKQGSYYKVYFSHYQPFGGVLFKQLKVGSMFPVHVYVSYFNTLESDGLRKLERRELLRS